MTPAPASGCPTRNSRRSLTPASRLLRLPTEPIERRSIASSPISKPISRRCSSSPSYAAIPICSAGSAACAHKIRPCPQTRAGSTWSFSAACSTNLASAGQLLQPGLILPEDIPPPPRRSPRPQPFSSELDDDRIQTLRTFLRPRTPGRYRCAARHFLAYLQSDFPLLLRSLELRRDPHLLGWLRRLGEQQDPPLSTAIRQSYPHKLWHLLQEVSSAGYPLQPDLMLPEDFPVRPRLRYKDRRCPTVPPPIWSDL